jgi:hypothetical protein
VTVRRKLAAVLMVACLALAIVPVAAFAQSAGDDQYQDPLGPGGDPAPSPSPSPSPSPPSGAGTAPGTAPTAPSGAAPASPGEPAQQGNVPLARTGFDALIPAVAGLLLLAGGAALLLLPRRQARRHG